jgi:hypothetical protein
MSSLSQSLASIRNELDATTARLRALVDTMDDATWRARPGRNRWSAAECVEHLNLTSRAYLPLLRDAVREGRARGMTDAGGAQRIGFVSWFLLRAQEPPVKHSRRIRTTMPFVPRQVGPKPDVVREYERLQRELVQLLVEAEGLALSRIRVRSPFFARLRYSVYLALRVIPAHQRRHLWQAEEAARSVRRAAR